MLTEWSTPFSHRVSWRTDINSWLKLTFGQRRRPSAPLVDQLIASGQHMVVTSLHQNKATPADYTSDRTYLRHCSPYKWNVHIKFYTKRL